MLLVNAIGADGSAIEVRIVGELIDAVAAPGTLVAEAGEVVVDLEARLLTPAFAEPHAHLDKAFLSERVVNPTGDLMGAILAMQASRALITVDDTVERAERAVRLMVANGATLIRSHADTTTENGLMSIEALTEVRRRVVDICDLQIVALVSWPITGTAGAPGRALLREALSAGADLVGGCPHLDTDVHRANEMLLDIASEFGRNIDLHTDETLDPGIFGLADLANRVTTSGFQHQVTASHCVSLAMQVESRQQEVAESVAAAGISIVALPHTNLFLQGRERQQAMPRAVTAIKALRAAGATVCAGADNLQDPFNPVGRADPLETAGLMIMAAHMLPESAFESVSIDAVHALTGHRPSLAAGERADLVALRAGSRREAIAFGPPDRVVVYRGRIVSTPNGFVARS